LTGFANFITRRVSDPEANGLFIVDRRFKSFEEGKGHMASIMYRYSQLTRRQRIQVPPPLPFAFNPFRYA